MKRITLLSGFFLFCLAKTFAQSSTSADIYLNLSKLNVLGSVLYIAAHPDDENTRLLTWLSKDKLYRTGYLSLTRGDGGQNLIGNEQGIELGLIRTQELLAARRIDGAEQFFTRAYDFGFSKTPEETFTKWDKEMILADVVWVIRQMQPDVIITRFPTTGEGGHGHHTASAILANEAFSAAADPRRFPEQLKWVQPWQAKRILWNAFNFGGTNTQRDDQLKIDVGAYNPVLGKSYGEIAADSRSQHKSQGFGVPRTRGEALEYFRATGGGQPQSELFENIETGWGRVAGANSVAAQVASITSSFDFLKPQKSVPALLQLYRSVAALPAGYWRSVKMREIQGLLEATSGLFLDAVSPEASVAQTDTARINFSVNNRLGGPVVLTGVSVATLDSNFSTTLAPNTNLNFSKKLFVPPSFPVTQPYWLVEKMNEGYFNVANQKDIGQPDAQPAMVARFGVSIGGEPFVFEKPVQYKFTDPVKGELYQPFVVLPPVLVNTAPSLVVVRKGEKLKDKIVLTARANRSIDVKDAEIGVGRELNTAERHRVKISKGGFEEYKLEANLPAGAVRPEDGVPYVRYPGGPPTNNFALSSIRYDHIPWINYFYIDAVKILPIDLKTAGKKVGYIVGAGDKVPEALEEMGYDVTLLRDADLARLNLQSFDAIISGVRAYNTNEWLNSHFGKLMNYVAGGGNLIVQYNTSNNAGPVRAKIGPFPFTISRNRITNENTPVQFLLPKHPVLNYPNLIGQQDFEGWVQERSIYHAADADAKFEMPLAMADPGERADSGSLVIAKHGKGYFTYTGLVFFRELPAGVPGAYRLLANLIALNQKKEM